MARNKKFEPVPEEQFFWDKNFAEHIKIKFGEDSTAYKLMDHFETKEAQKQFIDLMQELQAYRNNQFILNGASSPDVKIKSTENGTRYIVVDLYKKIRVPIDSKRFFIQPLREAFYWTEGRLAALGTLWFLLDALNIALGLKWSSKDIYHRLNRLRVCGFLPIFDKSEFDDPRAKIVDDDLYEPKGTWSCDSILSQINILEHPENQVMVRKSKSMSAPKFDARYLEALSLDHKDDDDARRNCREKFMAFFKAHANEKDITQNFKSALNQLIKDFETVYAFDADCAKDLFMVAAQGSLNDYNQLTMLKRSAGLIDNTGMQRRPVV